MNKITLITFLCISFFAISNLSQAQCHIDDWTALKALYESTDGDNWINKTNWQQILGNIPISAINAYISVISQCKD